MKEESVLGGGEAVVYEVKVTVSRRGRERTITLAEKEFHRPPWSPESVLWNPVKQFETMQELLELNRAKKLGLHILPTIRLRQEDGLRTLIITHYKRPKLPLSKEDWIRCCERRRKEGEILEREGYGVGDHAWAVIIDPTTKKPTMYLADFGHVAKKPKPWKP